MNKATQENGMEQERHDNTVDITERIVMTTEFDVFQKSGRPHRSVQQGCRGPFRGQRSSGQ
jgi:hypothetical protein